LESARVDATGPKVSIDGLRDAVDMIDLGADRLHADLGAVSTRPESEPIPTSLFYGVLRGLPVAVHLESATPHEVTLVHATLAQRFVSQLPVRLIGDNAYELDRLDAELARRGVELIAPHRRTRTQRAQDGRPLRRYQRRWKVERLFASFQNFRRVLVRYERLAENFLGMLHLAKLPHSVAGFMRWLSS
jgi:transposase